MKILFIADQESKALWDFYDKEKTKGVDLIISCGDLSRHYLEFLETMVNVPLLYVCGNHDTRYEIDDPKGCTPIDDRVYDFNGLRILGLGGSMKYKESTCMYTESEMRQRIKKLNRQISLMNGFDLLVTHAPARGYGDKNDIPHMGFECFNELMDKYHPKYMVHGHVHKEYGHFVREIDHPSGTKIINAYGTYMLEVGDDEHPAMGKTGSALYDLYINLKSKKKAY